MLFHISPYLRNMSILFKETQRFNQWWLWLILLGVGVIPIYGIYHQIILQQPFGEHPMPDTALITFAVFMLIFIIFFRLMQLKTTITNEHIEMHFQPFSKKRIPWNNVKSAEVIDYGFVGGWGIRIGTKYGTVYNIRGHQGLYIQLKNGRRFVIGTQKSEAMKKAILQYNPVD